MRSTSSTRGPQRAPTVIIALGSNLGDRNLNLRRALDALRRVIHIVRVSSVVETTAVDAPKGSPDFLNMVVAGHTSMAPDALLDALLAIETRLGRRRGKRNAPRTIDLDLILYGAYRVRTRELTVPHPRYLQREFVLNPMKELGLSYRVP